MAEKELFDEGRFRRASSRMFSSAARRVLESAGERGESLLELFVVEEGLDADEVQEIKVEGRRIMR